MIDFGVAKATNQQLTERTLFTNFAQMIGTPLYMSPEQAQMNEIDVDTRSDVYSLGVLLYELLTGSTPFDSDTLKEAGYDEMRRIIREDEPPKPSDRISTLAAKALSTVSEKRRHDPRRLSQSLKGELAWIVLRPWKKIALGVTNRPAIWRPTSNDTSTTSRSKPVRRRGFIARASWPAGIKWP